MVLVHCCHVFLYSGNALVRDVAGDCQSGILTSEIYMTLAGVNYLLKQKWEEQPSKTKYCAINHPEDVAQFSKASRYLSSTEGIAEEQVIQAIQGGKRSWGKKYVFVQAVYPGGKYSTWCTTW